MAVGPDLAGSDAAPAAGPTLDVRNNLEHSHASDQEIKDIYAYGAGLHSTNAIVGLSDFTNLQTLSLHGNQIERIEGLEVLHQLVTLNLSSNNITWMEGLSQLKNLRVLNLSNNRIREIAGLQGLVALRTLILSHNEISLLGGLSALHGLPYALQHLDLRDNLVEYLCELWILGGCSHLDEVVFECGGYSNPVCKEGGYRSTVLTVVPRLQSLDGSSCMGHAPLFNADMSLVVPSLWAIHHSYPGHQNPVNSGPRIPQPSLGDRNNSCILYTKPALYHQMADAKGTERLLPDSGQSEHSLFSCKYDTGFNRESSSHETGGRKSQDQFLKLNTRHILSHKSPGESYPDQAHCLQRTHDSYDHQVLSKPTRAEHESVADYARPELNLHHTNKPKNLHQGAKRSVHANAENLIVNAFVGDCDLSARKESSEQDIVFTIPGTPVIDFEAQHPESPFTETLKGNGSLQGTWSKLKDKDELDNSFSVAAGTDGSCRIVRFDGQSNKSALDRKRYVTRELATQTDSVFEPTSDQVCQEGNSLQPKLSAITVLIDGNCSYSDIGKQNFLGSLELYKKDNELLHLIKEKKSLEDDFAAFKKLVVHERNDWQADEEHKSKVLKNLRMNAEGCKVELKNLRKTVVQTEKELIAAVKHVESSIVSEETKKLSSMNSEILALKEALNSSLNTCQTVGTALNDANQQKDRAKKTLVSLSADLDEQRSKVKIIAEMLVTCTHQERVSRKECNRLKSELDMVCQLLRKNNDCKARDLIAERSPQLEAGGREETKNLSQQLMVDEFHRRLVVTQTMVTQANQENAKTLSRMKELRDTMVEKMLELGKAFEAVAEKEQGAKELITELSCIVSAQKTRAEWMQHELVRLTASKEVRAILPTLQIE
ncbi:hypothetical protein KC19_3G246600 [Ceratodon purpureus]|uniref:Leucine-rich repeat and coiled-coil domain-containing protein 1 n=2 Tax=Ceratodon purpureus TaxID=3225 RepID=A0A8T0IRE8_CERPU|nr:hypothetical protein KC19_3G246600 [Ceratodon purpureus]